LARLRRESGALEAGALVEPEERLIERVPRVVWLAAVGVLLLSLWQLLTMIGTVSPILLPGPAEVADEIVDSATNIVSGGHVAEALATTVVEILLGFIGAAVLGFGLGVLVGETRIGQTAVMPYLVGFNALPKVAFAPVFVAWFGFGVESKIVMAMFIAFFPMAVDTAAGLASVDRDALLMFRQLQAGRRKTLLKLKLPTALPYIFAGLKTATVFSVVGAIVGEYLGGGGGMGELVRLSAQSLRIDRVFALITYLAVVAMVMFAIVSWVERRVVFWQQGEELEGKAAWPTS